MSDRAAENAEVSTEERQRVAALRDALGIPEAAKKLGLSRDSLLRILAASPVHRGTVLVLREALARL